MMLVEIGTGEEFRLVNVDSSLAGAGDSWDPSTMRSAEFSRIDRRPRVESTT